MQDAPTEMTGQSPSANWRDRGWIAAAAGLCFFLALGTPRLWDEDEGFFAAAAREMHQRNDWVVPTFNGELFSHKPPFMFWMMRGGFFLFGETDKSYFGCGKNDSRDDDFFYFFCFLECVFD